MFLFLSSQSVYILFSCHITLARTSRMILKSHSERGHPCLVPNLTEKASSFSPSSRMLAIGFFIHSLYQVEKVSLFPSLLKVFVTNGRWIL